MTSRHKRNANEPGGAGNAAEEGGWGVEQERSRRGSEGGTETDEGDDGATARGGDAAMAMGAGRERRWRRVRHVALTARKLARFRENTINLI